MKSALRLIALGIIVTGALASSFSSHASAARPTVVARQSAAPVPMCPPDDPNACGLEPPAR